MRGDELRARAQKSIPGGVNSPVRAFNNVGIDPFFVGKSAGSKIFDVDGNQYLDYVMGYGPLILGHCHPKVVDAVRHAVGEGATYGACSEIEVMMAEKLLNSLPSLDKVRMLNSGTEAVMTSLRLARGFTGNDKIIKFDGCYHGHSDSMLVKAGSVLAGRADSLGVPEHVARDTLSLAFNDLDAVDSSIRENEVACVIVEPVCANNGLVLPDDGFLKGLRELTSENDVLLIFDEVVTGFRLCYGGAQSYFNVLPDLTCLGKIIGGGLPVGAVGGRSDVMDYIAPKGGVFQAGTFSGNPLTLSAGLATLDVLEGDGFYSRLHEVTKYLGDGLSRALDDAMVTRVESMISVSYSSEAEYARLFKKMLDAGIFIPPSMYETWFVSSAHTMLDVEKTLEALES